MRECCQALAQAERQRQATNAVDQRGALLHVTLVGAMYEQAGPPLPCTLRWKASGDSMAPIKCSVSLRLGSRYEIM